MSLRICRMTATGFRKFREPVSIDGLTGGLNIIIEPNETGKSTLLEALRAAFFVRHGTKNQLTRSYAPHGDLVAPQILVDFEVDGASWSVTKRFLKSMSVEVSGPDGRAQGEDAEKRLHDLLGSVKDTSSKGDLSNQGALGLLWVGQAEALSVTAPGQIVRDTVRSILEAEVGAIMGGPGYRRVRDRIEEQYGVYWTQTGQRRGRLTEAQKAVEVAEGEAEEAGKRLAALEGNFRDLEDARTRLKLAEREIADEADIQARKALEAELEVARSAAQILTTRRAEKEAANGVAKALEDLQGRHRRALEARDAAGRALAKARERRAVVAADPGRAQEKVRQTREALERARVAQRDARVALDDGQKLQQLLRRRAAVAAARLRYAELGRLETQYRDAGAVSGSLIAPEHMASLEKHERKVAEARARMSVGTAVIVLSGDVSGVTVDGLPMAAGEHSVTQDVTIRVGGAEFLVRPPASVASAELELADAQRKRDLALETFGVASLAEARLRNEAAREAAAERRTLAARIDAVTPADDAIGLAAGSQALRLFVRELAEDDPQEEVAPPDIAALSRTLEEAENVFGPADGAYNSAMEAQRRLETDNIPLAAAEAGAESDLSHAEAQRAEIENLPEFADLDVSLTEARKRAAEAAVKLEEAMRNATAHDPVAIARRMTGIDDRMRLAGETCRKLETQIAHLRGTIESEGGKGLAERDAAAREAADAAREAFRRVTDEAETIRLLRNTLDEARAETSARFAGPVARRVKSYVDRLMPGCDLTFSEDLGLEGVIRGGLNEECTSLSKGTQEQLAVLTRIAFADILLEQGLPVSLILDDPLVYSDDVRLELLIDVICDAAKRMQVILLTCRDRAFRHVPGNRVCFEWSQKHEDKHTQY
ncbi:AAA family ATPase [Acetobacter fallax]|uniref:AAA family ATPase n=1 Tax=Acetobacter fallax TaxID=1737473 RepID=A0ABX0KAF5_9PROT|nr:AAA family ATPase [Acetobacter fallax]NHO33385.1 AAA family ATPase [Acetobacter fallax]NHO37004.1 AAA family ATPase [Acetobacter fallax]